MLAVTSTRLPGTAEPVMKKWISGQWSRRQRRRRRFTPSPGGLGTHDCAEWRLSGCRGCRVQFCAHGRAIDEGDPHVSEGDLHVLGY